jgi:hypothetical protein
MAALLGTAAASAAAPAAAQPKPAAEVSEAVSALRRNAETLAKVEVPRDTEPAFRFQA